MEKLQHSRRHDHIPQPPEPDHDRLEGLCRSGCEARLHRLGYGVPRQVMWARGSEGQRGRLKAAIRARSLAESDAPAGAFNSQISSLSMS